MTVDGLKAVKKLSTPEYKETLERIAGWKCFYCRGNTKEKNCPTCKRPKEEAELKT